jgi:hypothetical protein
VTEWWTHVLAACLGLLVGAIVDWEDLIFRWRHRNDTGALSPRVAAGVASGVATVALLVLTLTPLELRDVAQSQWVRWAVVAACGTTALTIVVDMRRRWYALTKRVRGVGMALVVLVASIAVFEVEAFVLSVPVTGVRNVLFLLSVALLNATLLINFGSEPRRNAE